MAQYKVVQFSETKKTLSKYGTKEAKGTAVITRRDGTKVYINKGKTVATQSKGGKVKQVKTAVITSPSGSKYTVQQKTPEGKYYYATQKDLKTAKDDPFKMESSKEAFQKSIKQLKDQGVTVLNKPISTGQQALNVIKRNITDPVIQQQIIEESLKGAAVGTAATAALSFASPAVRGGAIFGTFAGLTYTGVRDVITTPAPFRGEVIGQKLTFAIPQIASFGAGGRLGSKAIRTGAKFKVEESPLIYRPDVQKKLSLPVLKVETLDGIQVGTRTQQIIPENIIARGLQATGAVPRSRTFTVKVEDIPRFSVGDSTFVLPSTKATRIETLEETFARTSPGFKNLIKSRTTPFKRTKTLDEAIIDIPSPLARLKPLKPTEFIDFPSGIALPRPRQSIRGGRGFPEFFSKDIGFVSPANKKIKLTELNKLKFDFGKDDFILVERARTRKRQRGGEGLFKVDKEGRSSFVKLVEGRTTTPTGRARGDLLDVLITVPQRNVKTSSRLINQITKPNSKIGTLTDGKVGQIPKISITDLTKFKSPVFKPAKIPAIAAIQNYKFDSASILGTKQIFKAGTIQKTNLRTTNKLLTTNNNFNRSFVSGFPTTTTPTVPPIFIPDLTGRRKPRKRKGRRRKGSQVRGAYTPSFTAIIKDIKSPASKKRLKKFTGLELRGL